MRQVLRSVRRLQDQSHDQSGDSTTSRTSREVVGLLRARGGRTTGRVIPQLVARLVVIHDFFTDESFFFVIISHPGLVI